MLRITIDMFSGRPNPRWEVAGSQAVECLQRISRNPEVAVSLRSGFAGLGMRGLIIEIPDENVAAQYHLPAVFRLANGTSQDEVKALEIAGIILETNPEFDEAFKQKVLTEIELLQKKTPELPRDLESVISEPEDFEASGASDVPPPEPSTIADGRCEVEIGRMNLPFWNGQKYWLINNNCYNYGTNRRTNTYAQPGKYSNKPISPTLYSVMRAAVSDGAKSQGTCQPSAQKPRWVMALVTVPDNFPDWDYHWYREHETGIWGHKVGQSIATDRDNSGNIIKNPELADRGHYTEWGGYFYAPASMNVS